ncbi:hypothetical protein F4803DRAFT_213599 [Xylaria telfairii]|nr:hypothetical protein F4803DRAFT_213599 [Xylaria telfairii]
MASSGSYRIYVQYGKSNCVRFFAPGDGSFAKGGLQLFEWIRNPRNITRLRNGLQHVYEVDKKELKHFLEFKLRENPAWKKKQIEKYPRGGDMLSAFRRRHDRFSSLSTGADKLEALANATRLTVIPRTSPRKRTDRPEWLYLIDLNQNTLAVYEFKHQKAHEDAPLERLTTRALYENYLINSPGYFIILELSKLQSMWRTEWIALHETHAKQLDVEWAERRNIWVTDVPHADNIPFKILYGSWTFPRYSSFWEATDELVKIVGVFNQRQPSKVSIFEPRVIHPRPRGGVLKATYAGDLI